METKEVEQIARALAAAGFDEEGAKDYMGLLIGIYKSIEEALVTRQLEPLSDRESLIIGGLVNGFLLPILMLAKRTLGSPVASTPPDWRGIVKEIIDKEKNT
jgi:hypothetical protein